MKGILLVPVALSLVSATAIRVAGPSASTTTESGRPAQGLGIRGGAEGRCALGRGRGPEVPVCLAAAPVTVPLGLLIEAVQVAGKAAAQVQPNRLLEFAERTRLPELWVGLIAVVELAAWIVQRRLRRVAACRISPCILLMVSGLASIVCGLAFSFRWLDQMGAIEVTVGHCARYSGEASRRLAMLWHLARRAR